MISAFLIALVVISAEAEDEEPGSTPRICPPCVDEPAPEQRYAQRGVVELAGGFSLSHGGTLDSTVMTFETRLGYFLIDGVEVGALVAVGYEYLEFRLSQVGSLSSERWNFAPNLFGRYVFDTGGDLFPFLSFATGFLHQTSGSGNDDLPAGVVSEPTKDTFFVLRPEVGVGFSIGKSGLLTASVLYARYFHFGGTELFGAAVDRDYGVLSLGLGLSLFY